MNFETRFAAYKQRLETYMEALPIAGAPDILRESMRYSLLSGGKRLRGVLCMASCEAAGGAAEEALPFAAALEMIHAYSLIHDDLPAMDNDTLRRGKPTSHVVYGEAVAILAGDALLTHAFELMSVQTHPHAFRAMGEIARAAGVSGMLCGQTLDVTLEGQKPSREAVRYIHLHKTADLLTAPITAGLLLADASPEQIAAGERYGQNLGLCFQIVDDLLDLRGDEAKLGKQTHTDAELGKMTWPAVNGIEASEQAARDAAAAAIRALDIFGNQAEPLRRMAADLLTREF